MFFYYLYMLLLVIALVLWTVIAVRNDGSENNETNADARRAFRGGIHNDDPDGDIPDNRR